MEKMAVKKALGKIRSAPDIEKLLKEYSVIWIKQADSKEIMKVRSCAPALTLFSKRFSSLSARIFAEGSLLYAPSERCFVISTAVAGDTGIVITLARLCQA